MVIGYEDRHARCSFRCSSPSCRAGQDRQDGPRPAGNVRLCTAPHCGAPFSKACEVQASQGSNPCATAHEIPYFVGDSRLPRDLARVVVTGLGQFGLNL
jgi:hypothetical protein